MTDAHVHLNVLIPPTTMSRLRRIQVITGGPMAAVVRAVIYEGLKVVEVRYLTPRE